MTATFEALGLAHLSPEARRQFANQLLADAETPPPPPSEWMKNYVREALAEARANPDGWIDGEEFHAQLEKEFPE
jgi:hypothetical protein